MNTSVSAALLGLLSTGAPAAPAMEIASELAPAVTERAPEPDLTTPAADDHR